MNPDAISMSGYDPSAQPIGAPPPIILAEHLPADAPQDAARRSDDDRRAGLERREPVDRRSRLDRRRGPGRRRTDYRKDAEEGHMNEEQLAFILAVDEYKRVNNRPFPTWTEVLDLLLFLGYRKVAEVGEFKLSKGRQTPLRTKAAPAAGPAGAAQADAPPN
jgi:hypothetical protein